MLRGVGFCLLLLATLARGEDPELRTLRRHGMSPTAKSLGAYLRALYPEKGVEEDLAVLIADLGSPSAVRRDYAMRQLHRAGASAASVLNRALDSEDPEVLRHVRWLLVDAQKLLESEPMYAAYMTIARRRIKGLAAEVLRTLPLAKDGYVRTAGRKALVATATQKSADLLRRAVEAGDGELRAASVRALAHVLGDSARPELRRLVADRDPRVQSAAAMALVELHDPAALPALVGLLNAPSPQIRWRTVRTLRSLAGRRFGYAAYADAQKRKKAMQAWSDWVKQEGAAVQWANAIDQPVGYHNRILVGVGVARRSSVVEIDTDGTVIATTRVTGNIQGVHGLANRHRLVSLWNRRQVVEYDSRGNEVWRSPVLASNPGCVQRLNNGNTMICLSQRGEVIEMAPSGDIVRTFRPGAGCYFAERLPNGITRVSLYNDRKFVELDLHGRVVRTQVVNGRPFTVRRLESGNVLACLLTEGRVDEIAPGGRVVRSLGGFSNPTSAFRIANGVTLVGDRRGVWRVDADGRRKHLHKVKGSVWISYY
ncbi:MAG: HEAT repeat domain-containing protein [Planctomycetota bacterium]|jgi:hypothetical protein